MANCLAGGLTLLPRTNSEIGFKLAAYPLDLLNASIVAQRRALGARVDGAPPTDDTLPFDELQAAVGFPKYYAEEEKYRV